MNTNQSYLGANWISINTNNNDDQIFDLAQKNNISLNLARLLSNRQIKKISNFINSKLKENISLADISKLSQINDVIGFFENVKKDKKVSIFSDYDVDGACAAAICKRFLNQYDIEVKVYIPNRLNEGYGLNQNACQILLDYSTNIIVLDCGSNNYAEQEFIAKNKGNLLIIDHHECESFYQDIIMINPKTPADKSSLNDLCATALTFLVLFYVVQKEVFEKKDILQYLDLVAMATVCDLVPLTSLNRTFVKQGLKLINSDSLNKGIQTLINQSKIKQKITEYHLGYILGPRINAGGRMGESLLGFQLLSSENIHQALQYAQIIESHNQNRQKLQTSIVQSIDISESDNTNINFFYNASWHIGIVGIIAGRLMRINQKPTFVMTYNNDVIVGSGRSMGQKNIGLLMMNAVEKGILIKGGGHHKACGFTLRQENLNQFREYLLSETDSLIIENNKQYESVLDINVINDKLLDDLDVLSPYGQLNPEPIFKLEKVKINILQIFKDKHAKLKFSDDLDFSCEGMFFDINAQDLKGYLSSKDEFDCYFKVKKDTYSSKTIIHLEDIH